LHAPKTNQEVGFGLSFKQMGQDSSLISSLVFGRRTGKENADRSQRSLGGTTNWEMRNFAGRLPFLIALEYFHFLYSAKTKISAAKNSIITTIRRLNIKQVAPEQFLCVRL
jgi:hypothetical protein